MGVKLNKYPIFCKKLYSILWIEIKFGLESKGNFDSNSNFFKNIDSNFSKKKKKFEFESAVLILYKYFNR